MGCIRGFVPLGEVKARQLGSYGKDAQGDFGWGKFCCDTKTGTAS